MPMIDVYATAGTFNDKHKLAIDLATTVMTIEQVPNIPMFKQNTAGFVHDLPHRQHGTGQPLHHADISFQHHQFRHHLLSLVP